MIKPSKLMRVPSSINDGTFFKWWIRFLSPYHSLTKREMIVVAELFYYRYNLSKTVSDPVILDKLTLNSTARKAIEEKLNLSHGYMNLIFTKLRKNEIIVGDTLNPRFVPDVRANSDGPMSFSVLILFDIRDGKGSEKKG